MLKRLGVIYIFADPPWEQIVQVRDARIDTGTDDEKWESKLDQVHSVFQQVVAEIEEYVPVLRVNLFDAYAMSKIHQHMLLHAPQWAVREGHARYL